MATQKGNLIVIYGANNLGKTTQAKMLVESLIIKFGVNAEYLKYAVYNLEPSGPMINNYLKEDNKYDLSAREFQMLHVLNRTQYEPTLLHKLEKGTWIVAEDYIATGIAWGMAYDIDKKFLYNINSHLKVEDLGILFEGEPFPEDLDKNNIHEADPAMLAKVTDNFKDISKDYAWHTLNANQTKEEVQENLLNIVKSKLTYLE